MINMKYTLLDALKSLIQPDGTNNPEVQGNWPVDAVLAVRYNMVDKQFPDVKHSPVIVYFSTIEESEKWFEEKKKWIKGTDFDFSISCDLYRWDLGPEYVGTLTY